jgi:hypothetical protein
MSGVSVRFSSFAGDDANKMVLNGKFNTAIESVYI